MAKCSVCGKITDAWDRYGCFFLEEEYPEECIYVCSTPCFIEAETKIESGVWKTPKLKKALGGAAHDISKPRKGYDKQPSQAELVDALLNAANVNVLAPAGGNLQHTPKMNSIQKTPTTRRKRVVQPRLVSRSIHAGDRVICIDDTGWLIPDPGFDHLSPKKGETYIVREYQRLGGVGAISLMEGHPDNFYRACRFRKISG